MTLAIEKMNEIAEWMVNKSLLFSVNLTDGFQLSGRVTAVDVQGSECDVDESFFSFTEI